VPQGIHELSIMLGYEATRDLEEISVQGVRIGIHLFTCGFPPPDETILCCTAIANQHFHGFGGQAPGRTHAHTARWIGHDRGPSDSVPVCLRPTPPSSEFCSLTCVDFSDAPVYHLGIYREKVSLQPVECQSLVEPCLFHLAETVKFRYRLLKITAIAPR
jgi:hypothetical protein